MMWGKRISIVTEADIEASVFSRRKKEEAIAAEYKEKAARLKEEKKQAEAEQKAAKRRAAAAKKLEESEDRESAASGADESYGHPNYSESNWEWLLRMARKYGEQGRSGSNTDDQDVVDADWVRDVTEESTAPQLNPPNPVQPVEKNSILKRLPQNGRK